LEQVQRLQPPLEQFLLDLRDGAWAFIIGVKDFLLGLIVSIYLLYNKEVFLAQAKKLILALFSEKAATSTLSVLAKTNRTFKSYFAGKALDSFIVGMLTFVGMTVFDMPYAVLISFLIGVCNMIPFFGPLIGAIPSILLILVEDPKQAVIFAIFILALQQFDGNFLDPKIQGDNIGLPTFWVLFAIFLGGGLFKFFGMVASVPLFAVIYMLLRDVINNRLKTKGLPHHTEDYLDPDYTFAIKVPKEERIARAKKAKIDKATPLPSSKDEDILVGTTVKNPNKKNDKKQP
jgi:predicted PurR-regulated permease PerM